MLGTGFRGATGPWGWRVLAGAVVLTAAFGAEARAGLSDDLSQVVLTVHASNDAGSGFFTVSSDEAGWNPLTGAFEWSHFDPGQAISIMSAANPGSTIAQLNALSFSLAPGLSGPGAAGAEGAFVNLDFAVTAGATDTEFMIASALVALPSPISPAAGRATAAATVTDLNGNGASLGGLHAGGGAYAASFNGGGETFAELLPSVAAGPFGSQSGSANFPGGGAFGPIGSPVSDIAAGFHFELSAGDLAGGTSHWEVIPAPGGLAVLFLAAAGRRRRRR